MLAIPAKMMTSKKQKAKIAKSAAMKYLINDLISDFGFQTAESTKSTGDPNVFTQKEDAWVKRLILTSLKKVYLSIGTNEGDRSQNLQDCLSLIIERIGPILEKSSIYVTSSWGFDSDEFLNMVIALSTSLESRVMLTELKGIEVLLGRVVGHDPVGYRSRTIDIDILTVGHSIIQEPGLRVPHPRLSQRNFVLMPWAEISPDLDVPGYDLTVLELLERCSDNGKCEKIEDV
jgi:2-amino-4-hydroxy-6-hydroxymethyldihydropteridine diphosphokinase